jgi:hypothetical protein
MRQVTAGKKGNGNELKRLMDEPTRIARECKLSKEIRRLPG